MRRGKACLWGAAAAGLVAAAGCTKEQTLVSPGAIPPTAVIKPAKADASDVPKRQPKAATCAKAGEWFEQAADEARDDSQKSRFFAQAKAAYEQALTIDPKDRAALFGMARLADRQKKYDEAVSAYRNALAAYPNDATIWFEFGMCYGRQKRFDESIDCLKRAVALDPTNQSFNNYLGWTYGRAGRDQECLAHFQRTVGEARAYYHVALMKKHLGQDEACRHYLRAALASNPELAEARGLLAQYEPPVAPVQQATHVAPAENPQPATGAPKPAAETPKPTEATAPKRCAVGPREDE
jgi:tetratricopeptide (TPR) repeat protein